MRLIARQPVHGVKAGEKFETDGAEACRLITYGYATPAHPGPGAGASFSPDRRRPSKDADVASALRRKVRAEELLRVRRSSGSASID